MDNGWRLITEDQPEKKTPVLLSIPGRFWGVGVVGTRLDEPKKNSEWLPLLWRSEIRDDLDYYMVYLWPNFYWLATHWMPLPEPPKKEECEDDDD